MICRRQRRGRPGVHDVGIADEAARLPPLLGPIARWYVSGRIRRQLIFTRRQDAVVRDASFRVDRIPHRERHAEKTLTADAPIAVQTVGPVLEARPHVRGMPRDLAAARDQGLPEIERLDEPLAAGHDLERPIALLVELDGMRDRPRIADEIARRAQLLHDRGSRLGRGQSGQRSIRTSRPFGVGRFPAGRPPLNRPQRSIGLDHRAHRQAQLPPPGHVGDVAERADHRDAAPLLGVGKRVSLDRHADAEERGDGVVAEQLLVARIVRMGDERHACGNQLGPRRFDLDDPTGAARLARTGRRGQR